MEESIVKRKPGRPRKNPINPDKNKSNNPPESLNREQIVNRWNTVFSKFYDNGGDYLGAMQSWYTNNPYVQNSRLKNLKINPMFQDRNTLETQLTDPGNNELSLRQMSWSLTANTYPYYKMIKMYTDLLSYRYYAYPKYVEKSDMATPRFKSDSKIVSMALDKLNPAYNFRRIVMECLIEGKRAYVPRIKATTTTGKESVDYFTLQELPSAWWKPVGKGSDSYYRVSFNFAYFWMPGTNTNQFPDEFTKLYNELMGSGAFEVNKEINKIEVVDLKKLPGSYSAELKDNEWYLWAEIPDAFVFSADESTAWQVPPFLGLFLGAQDLQSYYTLQTQLASIPLYGILTATVPLQNDNKTGSHINDLALSPDVVQGYQAFAQAILPPGVSALFAPFQNFKFDQFEEQVNSSKIYTDALQQFLGSSGTTSLLSTNSKPTVAQVKAGQSIEVGFVSFFYEQFINFVNIVFEKYLELKYTWRFLMFGDAFTDEARKGELKDGLSLGMSFLLPEYCAFSNIDLNAANCMSDWVDNAGIYDKFKQMIAAFNTSSGDKKSGRPVNKNPDNDNTAASQDGGGNTSDMRDFTSNNQQLVETIEDVVSQNED